jgi:hypothetical protein
LFAHKIRKEKKMGRILTAIFRKKKEKKKKETVLISFSSSRIFNWSH